MDNKIRRAKSGVVVGDKMDKTVVVSVERIKEHPIYKKKYVVSKKYKAHDEENQYRIGDVVEITPSRPFSKDKSYTVVKKIEK